jgi:hypothetical protein
MAKFDFKKSRKEILYNFLEHTNVLQITNMKRKHVEMQFEIET